MFALTGVMFAASASGSIFRIQLGNQVEVDPEEIHVTFDDVKGVSKQVLRWYFKLGHDHFLLHVFQFFCHPIIYCYAVFLLMTELLNELNVHRCRCNNCKFDILNVQLLPFEIFLGLSLMPSSLQRSPK
jgi:hypothetical protein